MDYEQKNPLPVPQSGAYKSVKSTIETVFDWQYALEDQKLLDALREGQGARLERQRARLVDGCRRREDHAREGNVDVFMNQLMAPPKTLSRDEAVELRLNMNAFMLSQFLHGEQGALIATAKIVQTVPWEEAKFYAANQVADEARHVEVYHRYLTEKLGIELRGAPEPRARCSTTSSATRAGTSPIWACRSWWRAWRWPPSA